MRKDNDTTNASEKMQNLYKELPRYKWPSVEVSGKYRCRVRRHVWETELAKNLAKYIPEKDKSVFYRSIGITPSDVPRILRGHIPTFDALCRYAENLGTTPDELVGEVREYETETIEDLWLFKEDTFRGMPEQVEIIELVEKYEPLDIKAAPDEVVTELICEVAGQAKKDIKEAEQGKKGANPVGAKTFLRDLHSALTGEYGKKHKNIIK